VRQPVVLREWSAVPAPDTRRFTTVASWRGPYGRVTAGDTTFGVKAHEFRAFITLPAVAGGAFEIALDIDASDTRDRAQLREHGWTVADPRTVAATPLAFRDYVRGSSAEFSVAQGIYVNTASGWFSDRTVRYLASGRPALVQDTGFSRTLPTGRGLIAFRTLGEAADGARRLLDDYATHARAARALAEEHFDCRVVLPPVLRAVGVES
jgi:hypothetical protein